MIRLKRAYEAAAVSDGQRFLVDRVWPRGRRREDLQIAAWLKEAGPSTELRKWFGHDPRRWPEFQRRYLVELDAHKDVLAPLLTASHRGDVTLVYGAKDEQHNQAVVIKAVLEERLARERAQGTSMSAVVPVPRASAEQGSSDQR
jgi:uncharacterized protein YeaO (DUF488 family)